MPLRGPVPVHNYSKATAEVVPIGPMTGYVFEDGTNTDNRIGCATLEIPPGVSGPPMHWHRFHDECFLITKGTVRFTTPEGSRDLAAGELMVVPPRAVHTFSNASETEPAEFFMTSTPGYYIDYFRMLGQVAKDKKKLTPAETGHLMALFGTFPPEVDSEP
ncbi:RmlC-like cupin domain-containing protein [Plectosphaerella cucumerina]|uniref:RmlC-like cupin domain-containing protein n=1 Tax=Plectosphaerella cucumerina TaxID=40658 RepID=A0A8K0TQS4_9PEZI|nr:RmlC-like cupin domain-containing protein [Plectosphaerella cucumerina]